MCGLLEDQRGDWLGTEIDFEEGIRRVCSGYGPDRLLIHYMQPHFPSVTKPLGSEIDVNTCGETWNSIWDQLSNNEIGEEIVKIHIKKISDMFSRCRTFIE